MQDKRLNPLISIITPVYNVEQYLDACLQSILKQTYSTLEIILINDESTDKSGTICDEYQKKYNNIKVIHQKNSGPSIARNAGIDVAKGDYICFVDSDDIVSENFIDFLLKASLQYDADLCLCDFVETEKPTEMLNSSSKSKSPVTDIVSKYDYFKSLAFVGYEYQHVKDIVIWNKLYRRELFSDLRFKTKVIHEDDLIIHKIIDASNKICYIKEPMYFYRIRTDSLIRNKEHIYSSFEELTMITAFKERLEIVEKNYPQLFSIMLKGYFSTLSVQLFKMKKSHQKERFDDIKSLLYSEYNYYNKQLNLFERSKVKIIDLFPNFSYACFNLSEFTKIKAKNVLRRLGILK